MLKMKSSISLLLVVICTVVLAAQQSQAKKGCQSYGHVCYGGHGKRSLASAVEQQQQLQQELMRPNLPMLPPVVMLPNEQPAVPDINYEEYPREFLIKIMKSWFGHPRRPADRMAEADYPISAETYNRENMNAIN